MDVLIVDDQPAVSDALRVLFEVHDVACLRVSRPEDALRAILEGNVGVVVQDMNFTAGAVSGREGIELFHMVRKADPKIPVVLLTAWTSLETAVALVKDGAADYLAKPWDDTKLVATVKSLLKLRELEKESERVRAQREAAREELSRRYHLEGIVYRSESMHRVVSLAVQIAGADVPVLITGPNGAGKEKIAQILQANSRRKGKPFLSVNAGALPDTLLESELFGAEMGAFTGAVKRRIGRFEAAEGGTLFLDEIGNLSPAGQVKLLRVLETAQFERLGSSETRRADVRVICATNVDLREAIAAGRFREDLFFRLNVIEIEVPALKDRPEDILPIAEGFLQALPAPEAGGSRWTLPPESTRALLRHLWPGNVRELLNRLKRATLVARGPALTAEDLGLGGGPSALAPAARGDAEVAAERGRLEELFRRVDGNVSKAAEELGLSRQALYRKMERLGVVLERRPKD